MRIKNLWHSGDTFPEEGSYVFVKLDNKLLWSVYQYIKGYFWTQNHWENNYRILKFVEEWCYIKDVENAK